MTNWIDLVNFAVAVGGFVVVLLGFLLARILPYMDHWSRKFFSVFFLCLIAYVVSDLISQISLTLLGEEYHLLSGCAIFLESFFSSLLMPLLTIYLIHCSGGKIRKSRLMYAVCFFWTLYFVLLIITQFTTQIYYITESNVYQRGTLYPLLLIPPALLVLINLLALWRRKSLLTKREWYAFMLYLVIPLVCILVQMLSYGLLLIVIGTCISSLILFIFILLDQIEHYEKQRIEIARQQTSIRVLQMRPHFIYNTMTSIYYLCKQDADKAQQVILDFNSYLRRNFTAIVKEGTIPFSEELEHVRAYLAVEQVRFEGKLYVKFDTPHTSFRIPPLTIQPLIENAVKHGVDPELEPLYITIRTRETENGSEIIVEDSGPGFEIQKLSDVRNNCDSPHIALENIRERLSTLCRGSITITPREGNGTVVTITILNR